MSEILRTPTTDFERELVDENKRLRKLLDWIVSHEKPRRAYALFEFSTGDDGVFHVLACAPEGCEEQMAREAATQYVGLIEKYMGKMTIGEMQSKGSVTVGDDGGTPAPVRP